MSLDTRIFTQKGKNFKRGGKVINEGLFERMQLISSGIFAVHLGGREGAGREQCHAQPARTRVGEGQPDIMIITLFLF